MPLLPIRVNLDAVPTHQDWTLYKHLKNPTPQAYTFSWHDEFHTFDPATDVIKIEFPNLATFRILPTDPGRYSLDIEVLCPTELLVRLRKLGGRERSHVVVAVFELVRSAAFDALMLYARRGCGLKYQKLSAYLFGAGPEQLDTELEAALSNPLTH